MKIMKDSMKANERRKKVLSKAHYKFRMKNNKNYFGVSIYMEKSAGKRKINLSSFIYMERGCW